MAFVPPEGLISSSPSVLVAYRIPYSPAGEFTLNSVAASVSWNLYSVGREELPYRRNCHRVPS